MVQPRVGVIGQVRTSTLKNLFPILFYFTNGRYIECLSLTCATNESKTEKNFTLKKKKKRNIHSKYKVLMLKSSHTKSNNKITKSIFHHLCPGLPVSLIVRLVDNAVQCLRWFLSVGAWRLHSVQ